MNKKVWVGGVWFPQKIYEKNIQIFKEGLAHTSLSCEQAFESLYEYEEKINKLMVDNSEKLYNSLPDEEKEQITNQIRFFVIYSACYNGVLSGDAKDMSADEISALYLEHFEYFDRWMYRVLVFDKDKKYDERASYSNIVKLFRIAPLYQLAYDTAHNMKKDHLEAFDYALTINEITPGEIIKINTILNQRQPEKEEGFKKVDNIIQGAQFDTGKKQNVPTQIVELVHNYNNSLDHKLADFLDTKMSREERRKRLLDICRREAIFHIEFERIHPFADGNGRTGRVLLNRNLIKSGLAPVLINEITMDKYKKFIAEKNYDDFA